MTPKGLTAILCLALVLSACARDGSSNRRSALNLRGNPIAPDEFLVVPQSPLQEPADYVSLPQPTPGAPSPTEIDSEAQLLAALGGRPTTARRGVPASDQALLAAVTQNGVTADIRAVLQAEDQAYRNSRSGSFERRVRRLEAVTIYDRMLLDPDAELARLRALGIKVPSAP